jgi:glycosyltransferase involved in cell wall biosynthesis
MNREAVLAVETRPWLLVSGDFTPLGGMDRANHALASYLARSGHETHLVTHRAWDDLSALSQVRVHRVARPGGKHLLGSPLLARAGRREARRIAGRGTRVLVNGGNCAWGDVNWVHYVHAAHTPRQPGSLLRRTKATLFHRAALAAERSCLRRARVVIANSERTRADLVERVGVPAERIHTVYYGSEPGRFRPASEAERAEARRRLGWDDDRPTIAFVGALGDTRKGFDTLFDAWGRLVRGGAWDARLAVVGTGASLEDWRRRAGGLGGSIDFLGFRKDVPEVLRGCDALVSPTRYEAYGLGVHEALCCGLPALVSRSAGVAERYPAELEDWLIPDPDDAADLAARLGRWRERAATPSAALADFSARLRGETWDHMAGQIVAVVEEAS